MLGSVLEETTFLKKQFTYRSPISIIVLVKLIESWSFHFHFPIVTRDGYGQNEKAVKM